MSWVSIWCVEHILPLYYFACAITMPFSLAHVSTCTQHTHSHTPRSHTSLTHSLTHLGPNQTRSWSDIDPSRHHDRQVQAAAQAGAQAPQGQRCPPRWCSQRWSGVEPGRIHAGVLTHHSAVLHACHLESAAPTVTLNLSHGRAQRNDGHRSICAQ